MNSDDLAIYGYKGKGIEEFHEVMAKIYYINYYKKYVTVERLLCEPKAALAYYEEVKRAAGIQCPVNELLEELLKIRKNKVLDALQKLSL